MRITIPGNPIPKARARVTKKGFAYDPQWEQKINVMKFLEHKVRDFFKKDDNRIEGHKLSIGEAFEVDWYFHMPIPKSFSQSKKNACKWGLIEHTSKPDRSNLEKFSEDCANGILWKDDSQITKGSIEKKYCSDDKPRTEIFMKPVKMHNEDVKDIISLFSPDEITSLVYDASVIRMDSEPNLPQITTFLSKLADQHAKKLSKISKTYPGHWKKFESNSSLVQY